MTRMFPHPRELPHLQELRSPPVDETQRRLAVGTSKRGRISVQKRGERNPAPLSNIKSFESLSRSHRLGQIPPAFPTVLAQESQYPLTAHDTKPIQHQHAT